MVKAIPERPDYSISEDGRVFGPKGVVKIHATKKGYLRVNLTAGIARKVHRLVAQAFVPNPDNLPEVNHKDGDKLNNHFSNLEWCTRKQNMAHAFATGLCKAYTGERSNGAKLKDSEVSEIRALFRPRHPEFGGAALGRRYGVDQSRIHQIVKAA